MVNLFPRMKPVKKYAEFWQPFLYNALVLRQVSLQQELQKWEGIFVPGMCPSCPPAWKTPPSLATC